MKDVGGVTTQRWMNRGRTQRGWKDRRMNVFRMNWPTPAQRRRMGLTNWAALNFSQISFYIFIKLPSLRFAPGTFSWQVVGSVNTPRSRLNSIVHHSCFSSKVFGRFDPCILSKVLWRQQFWPHSPSKRVFTPANRGTPNSPNSPLVSLRRRANCERSYPLEGSFNREKMTQLCRT